MANDSKKSTNTALVIVALIAIAVAAAMLMRMPDQRTTGERIGDAVDKVVEGDLEGAGRALEERNVGEKIGDAVKDAGEEIKEKSE